MSQLEQSTVPETPAQEEGPPAAPSPLWRWLTVALLILGLLLTVLFALRATRSFRTFHDERGRPPLCAPGFAGTPPRGDLRTNGGRRASRKTRNLVSRHVRCQHEIPKVLQVARFCSDWIWTPKGALPPLSGRT